LLHRRPIADALASEGHDVLVVAGGTPPPDDVEHKWTYRHVPIWRFGFSPLTDALLALTTLYDLIFRRPAAMQLITLKPIVISGLFVWLLGRIGLGPGRIVLTVPGLGRFMSPKSRLTSIRARCARKFVKFIIRRVAHDRRSSCVFENGEDRAFWVKDRLVDPVRAIVIKGAGVDPSHFYPGERVTAVERRPLRVLFASRLIAAKGLGSVIGAARILNCRDSVEFLVAGINYGNDPDEYSREYLESEESIKFLGHVRDVASLLRSVDLVCLPTLYSEGIPRIIIEAAACGVPAIVTDMAGCREIVSQGVTGTLIQPGETDEMAVSIVEAIRRYVDDPMKIQDESRNCLTIWREGRFRVEDIVKEFKSLLLGN